MAVRRRETVRHRRSILQQRARPKSVLYGSASKEIPASTRRSAISGNDNNLICLILSPVINDNATAEIQLSVPHRHDRGRDGRTAHAGIGVGRLALEVGARASNV
jgi:hypothetical protein